MIEGTLITHYADLYQTVSDNSYDKLAIQVRGNGSVNTVCPGIGFHQPGLYGGYLIMSTANDFSFYRYAGAYGNVSAGDFQSNGWFRTNGNFGWYNSTYGGGLYMCAFAAAISQVENGVPAVMEDVRKGWELL